LKFFILANAPDLRHHPGRLMDEEMTPEELKEAARKELFEGLENIIHAALCAGIDDKEITDSFIGALRDTNADVLTPEEYAKKHAKEIEEYKRDYDEWKKAHPEAMTELEKLEGLGFLAAATRSEQLAKAARAMHEAHVALERAIGALKGQPDADEVIEALEAAKANVDIGGQGLPSLPEE
jgi:hypothetical protein